MTTKKTRAGGRDQESIERHYTRVDFEDDRSAICGQMIHRLPTFADER